MKVLLLDGNSFCYRAFYAVAHLTNSKGEPTNAVYGFVTMLEKIIKETKPGGICVAFDVKGPTFRHEKYADYKAHRKPMPDELVTQMPLIKEVVRGFNIPLYEKQGYEADDIIATLAKKLEKKGHEPIIVTGDKDALQLVNKKIKVLNPQKENFIYDEAAVKARFGVGPSQVVEIMALMGDASDNIPGVPGIGDKTASKLIIEYGSLENVLKNISKIKGEKLQSNLKEFEEQARLSKELATIDDNAPIDLDLEEIHLKDPDYEKLSALYKKLEFKSLLKTIPDQQPKNSDDSELSYELIKDEKSFEALKAKLAKKKEWAFDFETTSTDPLLAKPVGISFSFQAKEAYYVAFRVEEGLFTADTALSAKKCLESLKKLFEDESIKKIGHNIKYEMLILKNFGIELKNVHFDTMVASYCLNPAKPNHNMDDVALAELDIRITSIKELIGSGKKQITMAEADLEKVYRYGCQDSDITFRLYQVLDKKIEESKMKKLFQEIEMPLISVLAEMEWAGIAIDKKLLKQYSKDMEKELEELTKDIHRQAGKEFNINSPLQLQEILFEKLALPVVKKTKTGASTDVEVLTELSEIHPLPKTILRFRELSKLKSTYVDALPELVNPRTGRVHTSFNQTVTATGRLSSSDPNVQNIPIRSEEGRKIRRAFIAGDELSCLVSADYSQIELRVLAHLSEDKNLTKAFKDGVDVHRYTASLIFNVALKDVTESMRASAKTVNFGVLYGMGPFSLAKSLSITNEAAKDFIKAYFERYSSVKKYLDSTIEEARKNGYVETYFKRRRYIPEIASRDMRLRSFAERTAINAPIQGTASDIIKIAMNNIQQKIEKFDAKMLLQVHDELLFEVETKKLEPLLRMICKEMEGAVEFEVPLDVSVKSGPNWLDMKEIKN